MEMNKDLEPIYTDITVLLIIAIVSSIVIGIKNNKETSSNKEKH